MNKIVPQTTDITAQNIDHIAQLFPEVITEKEDASGNITKAIDFEQLKQHLSKDIVEGSEERYRLDWPGKRASILKANTPITTTLKPDRDSSVNFDTTENLYIEGDNFEVLKVLQESYLGKIKMIYIDPPYNTGKDFVYKDNFRISRKDYENELGVADEEGGKLFKNTDTNGRFHSDWLSMMYERLLVARDLLKNDGVIFMSIDDNEVHNLRKIADEVFGEENFLANIIWQSRTSISNDDDVSTNHNHSLIFTKNITKLNFHGEPLNPKDYSNSDDDSRGPWKLVPIDANKPGGATYYPIKNPNTKEEFYPPNGRSWAINEETFNNLLKDGRIKFGKSGNSAPKKKLYLYERLDNNESKTPSSILLDAGTTKSGTEELMSLFDGQKIFDYPKPSTLIERFLNYSLGKDDNAIILDFFSGSSSTSEAAMRFNLANHKANVTFIMVQYPENLEQTLETAKGLTKKTTENAINFLKLKGKPLLLSEIGMERIRRAGAKIIEENVEKLKKRERPLDVGFRVYKTSASILKDVAKHPNELLQTALFDSQDNIKEYASDEDILTSVILDFGVTLDLPIEKKTIAGSTVFIVDTNVIVACFDKNMDMAVVDAMTKIQPLRAVFRDACFKDDKDLINTVESRFKQASPETDVHVI